MISNYGTSAIIDFKRLTQSFANCTDYSGMTCKLYCILQGLGKYFLYRYIGDSSARLNLLETGDLQEIAQYISAETRSPMEFESRLNSLNLVYKNMLQPYNRNVTITEDAFLEYLHLVRDFLLWYKDSTPISILIGLYEDCTGRNTSGEIYEDTEPTRDYIWWHIGFDNIVRLYEEVSDKYGGNIHKQRYMSI